VVQLEQAATQALGLQDPVQLDLVQQVLFRQTLSLHPKQLKKF
jgi:hypothetical protein